MPLGIQIKDYSEKTLNEMTKYKMYYGTSLAIRPLAIGETGGYLLSIWHDAP